MPLKILLSAFACRPGLGSEPSVGWEVALQAARRHDVWVLTDGINRFAVDGQVEGEAKSRIRFEYVSLPRIVRLLHAAPFFHQIYYIIWQVAAFFHARRIHSEVGFDLVHHVTYVNSWIPTFLGRLPGGVPLVWSAGGRERTRWPFYRYMSLRATSWEVLRDVSMALLGPLTTWITARRSKVILTSSNPSRWATGLPLRSFALGGLSIPELRACRKPKERHPGPFRVISVGRLLGLKGFELSLRAFAHLRVDYPDAEYTIVGEGPEAARLRRVATELGCKDSVRFSGWLSREEVLSAIYQADVLVHPGLHESFCFVLLEAMASGKPVATLNIGGPAILADTEAAFRIPMDSPEAVIRHLTEAMLSLAENPESATARGENLSAHAERHWTWEHVGDRLLRIYDEALS
jgi:glycosyltransferase involved in cell wall biosynthesis